MSRYSSLALAFALLWLYICSVSLTEARKAAFGKHGFSVELIHRDSSKSPFYRSSETHFQRVTNAIRRSTARANHLNNVSPSDFSTPQTVITTNPGEYLMSYSVGTPPFQILGVLDTGSDIIWFQCKPCENCFKQTSPLFDPLKSSTYRTVPCDGDMCQAVRDSMCTDGRTCEYNIQYGDGSYSQGPLGMDTLTLGSTGGSPFPFPKTYIGCGTDNKMSSFVGNTSGIVGLANGPASLVTQLGNVTKGKFSYCLAPMFSKSNVSTKLNFGDSAIVSGRGTVSTPIVPPGEVKSVHYYLRLEGFSIGDNRVEFESVSDTTSRQGNIIIDSGTTVTILPGDVYSKLESAVAEQVKLKRVKSPIPELSLCYQIESGQLEVPLITAHFTGADVKLNALNTFVEVAKGVMCLAFRSSDTLSIFGNLAQQNFLVGYDTQNHVINFKPTDCTKY